MDSVFNSRKKTNDEKCESMLLIQQDIKKEINKIALKVRGFYKADSISILYSKKIMTGIIYIIEYYWKNYGIDKSVIMEVEKMIREIFDPELEKNAEARGRTVGQTEGKIEGQQEFLILSLQGKGWLNPIVKNEIEETMDEVKLKAITSALATARRREQFLVDFKKLITANNSVQI